MRVESTVSIAAFGVALLWLPLIAHGAVFIYSAEAIQGWVVDAETGKPIEGVNVVAHWQLRGGFEGGNPVDELKILETVTDHGGRYSFPAWGPKFALMGHLRSESPEFLMFKQGYKFQRLINSWYSGRDTSKSDWNAKTVKLDSFNGTLGQYAEHLSSLSSGLENVGYRVGNESGDYCGWKMFPRMLLALNRLEADFRRNGVTQGTVVSFLKANDQQLQKKGCGSVFEILGAEK